MNRGTALLLAMAALLGHALTIHVDSSGFFAEPHDFAHVAFRLARNLVRTGELVWNLGGDGPAGGLGTYPSLLWIGVAAVAERLYLPVNTFCQVVGILAALLTVAASARFATDRFAGIIPAALLVASGGLAAAASSGTETPLFALFFLTAFVAYEHRRRNFLALALVLMVATRPEGVVVAVAIALFALGERIRRRETDARRPTPPWPFLAAAVVAAVLFLVDGGQGGSYYGVLLGDLLEADGARISVGLAYVRDAVVSAVTPLLLVFPIAALVVGRLSGVGQRALALSVLWTTIVVLEGGGPLPFTIAMVPALPLIFIAVQQGIIAALDAKKPALEPITWTILVLGVIGSGLASKFPGDLGPLRVTGWHNGWMEATSDATFGRDRYLGRLALAQEIEMTGEMRDLASFLRHNVDPGLSILTPWPGAIGYVSNLRVFDFFGRTTAPSTAVANAPWRTRPRTDLLAAIRQEPDFILPGIITKKMAKDGMLGIGIDRELFELDIEPSTQRAATIESALSDYELVTVPVRPVRGGGRGRIRPFYLLRRKDLGFGPVLEIQIEGGRAIVEVAPMGGVEESEAPGHPQIVRLHVRLVDTRGKLWTIGPQGLLSEQSRIEARSSIELHPNPDRPIRLIDFSIPEHPLGLRFVEVRAFLNNPWVKWGHQLAPAGDEASVRL